MLDLGVGTGRTTYTFAPLVGDTWGSTTRRRCSRWPGEVLPAPSTSRSSRWATRRYLEGCYDEQLWDLVLFSFNGISAMGHDERLDSLRQVRERLVADGLFCFSAHSAHSLPLGQARPAGAGPAPPDAVRLPLGPGTAGAQGRRQGQLGCEPAAFDERGWDLLADGSHGFRERWYYVTIAEQLRQLDEAGFGAVEVLGNDAQPVDPGDPGRDPWLHYFCQAG